MVVVSRVGTGSDSEEDEDEMSGPSDIQGRGEDGKGTTAQLLNPLRRRKRKSRHNNKAGGR